MLTDENNSADDKPTVLKLRGFSSDDGNREKIANAKKFVDDMYGRFPVNPLDSSQFAMVYDSGEDQKLALVELNVDRMSPGNVVIKWISTYPQRQGVGTKALSDLQSMAREAGVKLSLSAWKQGKVPERVLNRFYKKMGFKPGRYHGGLQWDPSIDEGEVIPFARPALKPDSQNLHLARSLASELFWIQASTYGTEEEEAAERDLEDRLAKIGYKAEWDTDDTEFNMVITHIASGKRYHMGEKELIGESWSNSYKKSINCSNPKGFSQRAHCAARRKRAHGGKTKSKPVREDSNDDANKNLPILLRHVAESFRDKNAFDALDWMAEGGWTVNDSPAIKAIFDANLKQIGGLVMQEIRQGDADAGVIGSIREMVENIGINMPNDRIAEYLHLQIYHIDKVLSTLIEDRMIQNAIMLAEELNEWGLSYELDDFIDLENDKDLIIKTMLRDMKANRLNWTRRLVEILRRNGVDWPELTAFEKSINASPQAKLREAVYDPETYDDSSDVSSTGVRREPKTKKRTIGEPTLKKHRSIDRSRPLKFEPIADNPEARFPDPEDDGIRADPMTKDIKGIGQLVLSGHFRDRLRQRKINMITALDLFKERFGNDYRRILTAPFGQKMILKDPYSHLGMVMVKDPMKLADGRPGIRFTLITAHPDFNEYKRKNNLIFNEMDDKLLDKPTPTIDDLAKKYDVSPQDVLRELAKGVEIEQEHTDLLHVAREIALDHLGEDLYYYVKLAKAEKDTGSQATVPSEKVREAMVPKKLPKTEAGWLTAVSRRPDLIGFNPSPSEAVQIAALKKEPDAIGDIENPSEDMQLFAVQQDGDALRSIKDPSKAVQMAAVNQNGRSISYVKDPSEEMKIAAVKRYGMAIGHIRNPSKAVQAAAIVSDAFSLAYISNLDRDLLNDPEIKKAIMTRMLSLFHTRIDMSKEMLRHLKRAGCDWPELEVIERSINADNAIKEGKTNLNTAGEAAQLAAVKKDGMAIEGIKNPSEAVQLAAVKETGLAIQFIEQPSEAVQMAAVMKDDAALMMIEQPTEAVQLAALKRDGESILFIEKPTILDNPEAKAAIIKAMLVLIRKNNSSDDNDFLLDIMELLNHLRKLKVNWPELDSIRRSLRADKLIKESKVRR